MTSEPTKAQIDLEKGKTLPLKLSFEKTKASLIFAKHKRSKANKTEREEKPNGNLESPCLGSIELRSMLDWNGNP